MAKMVKEEKNFAVAIGMVEIDAITDDCVARNYFDPGIEENGQYSE